MESCRHLHLVLLPQNKGRLRCKLCHLSITEDELQDGYCPECFEETGKKTYDFVEVQPSGKEKTRYRCEECGAVIEAD